MIDAEIDRLPERENEMPAATAAAPRTAVSGPNLSRWASAAAIPQHASKHNERSTTTRRRTICGRRPSAA